MANNFETLNDTHPAANSCLEQPSDVTENPEWFTRYQHGAMKRREVDLTELPDHPQFIEVLKRNDWDSPQAENLAKGRIKCLLSYDGTIKTCVLTGEKFIAPVPLAFFYEGDREKPVDPHHALARGFLMDKSAFLSVCWSLCNEADLRHWLPMAYAWADWNDQTWVMDYGQFSWNPGEVIDDYFDMHLEGFRDLVERRKRGEALPEMEGVKSAVAQAEPEQTNINKQEN